MNKKLKLFYVGDDDANRPIYKNEDYMYFKDHNPKKDEDPLIVSVGLGIKGQNYLEQYTGFEFVPKRITWD